jgi:hypothetical protein
MNVSSPVIDSFEDQRDLLKDASDQIAIGSGALHDVDNLRACLVEILEHLERDAGIEAAAHDLYRGAVAIVESGSAPTRRQQRLFEEAAQRFQERLNKLTAADAEAAHHRCG